MRCHRRLCHLLHHRLLLLHLRRRHYAWSTPARCRDAGFRRLVVRGVEDGVGDTKRGHDDDETKAPPRPPRPSRPAPTPRPPPPRWWPRVIRRRRRRRKRRRRRGRRGDERSRCQRRHYQHYHLHHRCRRGGNHRRSPKRGI